MGPVEPCPEISAAAASDITGVLVKSYACARKFDPCRDITNTHACKKFGKKPIRNMGVSCTV
jgi:hypothetical protein